MIGNKIAQRTFVDRNLPHASALSACLMLAVLSPLIAILLSQGRVTGFLRGSNQDQQGVSDHET
jgi:ABC-type spermidine/putrescine transport system permease subunit I